MLGGQTLVLGLIVEEVNVSSPNEAANIAHGVTGAANVPTASAATTATKAMRRIVACKCSGLA
jgi:predicted GNAT superfamily acetyltransferase